MTRPTFRRAPRHPLAALALALAAHLALLSLTAAPALAETPAAVKKAGKHFQRGVVLYNEADYRAALVEFRRAYEVAPNPAVLYNIGQTYYQLQSYAQALTTFERYLAEAGDAAPHRKEVDETVEVLRARVGKLNLTLNREGCEVTVDDELVGKSPLGEPVLVSIGRRKIIAMCEGRPAETRVVEVAAGDVVEVSIAIAAPPTGTPPGAPAGLRLDRASPAPASSAASWRKAGWIGTGVLAAAALTTGTLAVLASRDLDDERHTFPSSLDTLDDKSARLRRLSLAADVLGAAALVVGGVTLTFTLTSRSRRSSGAGSSGETPGPTAAVRLGVSPGSVSLSGHF